MINQGGCAEDLRQNNCRGVVAWDADYHHDDLRTIRQKLNFALLCKSYPCLSDQTELALDGYAPTRHSIIQTWTIEH